jgi:solute:Na+ symporter, SSS family
MNPMLLLDLFVFFGFIVLVIAVGIGMSGKEKDSEDYFLAGRGLTWWLIGFSLIAANISSEQFIGMSGQAAMHVGLAIASYEWMAAITLVVVAFFFLPKFLGAGIYTIPEYLEYRFNRAARSLMSLLMVAVCILVSFTAVVYSGALTATILFGDVELWGGFRINVTNASWVIGILSAFYVVAGGLKACAWADLIQGSALIVGGTIVSYLAFQALGQADPATIGLAAEQAVAGPIERFRDLNSPKLHMALPRTDLILPWTALVVGLWIPNFYYWGLNQYIVQRTLGSQSVAAGQRGIVFAAGMKLIIPFIIVLPGIIAYNLFNKEMIELAAGENQSTLSAFEAARANPQSARQVVKFDKDFASQYADTAQQILTFNQTVAGTILSPAATPEELVTQNEAALAEIQRKNTTRSAAEVIKVSDTITGHKYDAAFPLLMKRLVFNHPGVRAFVLAALLGAVISSLAAVLNAASTMFTMDLYRVYMSPNASQGNLVTVGRLSVVTFTALGCWIAPTLNSPELKGIFSYIQEFQGFFSPGVLAVFIYGMFVASAPRICGMTGILLNPIVYAFLKWGLPKFGVPEIAFLDRMAISFGVTLAVLGLITVVKPLREPIQMPEQTKINLTSSAGAKFFGVIVVIATLALYWVFW